MPRLIADGEVKIQWVPTIADPDNPTIGEINAGTEVTGFLSSLETPLEGTAPGAMDLSSAFQKTVAGTFGGQVNGTIYRDDTTDTAWTLWPRNTTGYLVIRRFGGSDVVFAIADVVEVWNLRVVTRSPVNLESETVQAATVNFATLDEPSLDVAVAA